MNKLISLFMLLFLFGGIFQQQSVKASPCLSETYIKKVPYQSGAVAIDSVQFYDHNLDSTFNVISTINYKEVDGEEKVYLNEFWGQDGSLRNSFFISTEQSHRRGVDLNGQHQFVNGEDVIDYYIIADASPVNAGNNPPEDVALYRVRVGPSGATLLWELMLGYNGHDNKAVSVERLPNGDALVIGNSVVHGGCPKVFAARVTSSGSVSWKRDYGDCLLAHGSTVAKMVSPFFLPGSTNELHRLAITGETDSDNGPTDIFILLINENTGAEIWTKTYDFYGSNIAALQRGFAITSYTEFVWSGWNPSRKNRLVVTGEIITPYFGFPEGSIDKNAFALQVKAENGNLDWMKEYEVLVPQFGGSDTKGTAIRSVDNKQLVIAGRLAYDDNNNEEREHVFQLKLDRGGNVNWVKTYLERNVMTEHIDMVPSLGDQSGCEFYNIIAIGESGPFPFVPDFFSLLIRTDENGIVADGDCPDELMDVSVTDGGFAHYFATQEGDEIWLEHISSFVENSDLELLDCGEIFMIPGSGLRIDNSADFFHSVEMTHWSLNVSPNPVQGPMKIRFDLASSAHITIEIYSLEGQLIDKVIEQEMEAGKQRVHYDASHLISGMYLCKVSSLEQSESIRFVKLDGN